MSASLPIFYGFDDGQDIYMPNRIIPAADFKAEIEKVLNDDKPTPEGYAKLDAEIAEPGIDATKRLLHDVKVQAAKVEMFGELVGALFVAHEIARFEEGYMAGAHDEILERARKLQRGELP